MERTAYHFLSVAFRLIGILVSNKTFFSKVRSGRVPVQYLSYLALDIQGQVAWKSFGHSLLNDPELNGIEKDNDEVYERCYKMLKRCHQSGIATYKDLADALQDHGLDSIREEYCLEGHDPPTRPYPVNLSKLSALFGELSAKN